MMRILENTAGAIVIVVAIALTWIGFSGRIEPVDHRTPHDRPVTPPNGLIFIVEADDSCWATGSFLSGFSCSEPIQKAPP